LIHITGISFIKKQKKMFSVILLARNTQKYFNNWNLLKSCCVNECFYEESLRIMHYIMCVFNLKNGYSEGQNSLRLTHCSISCFHINKKCSLPFRTIFVLGCIMLSPKILFVVVKSIHSFLVIRYTYLSKLHHAFKYSQYVSLGFGNNDWPSSVRNRSI
jgi:hypothetical protein